MKQTTFASVAWEKKGKVTRRERFLAEMDAVIPWTRLLALIEPHYPKAGNGIPDETTILRFRHLLEQHQLTEQMFAEIRSLLEQKRLLLKSGDDHRGAALDEERAKRHVIRRCIRRRKGRIGTLE